MAEPVRREADLLGAGRFPHLLGWWVEITPDKPTTRRRFLRSPVTTQTWMWMLKRPDPQMPFGFSISGSGHAKSEERALADATAEAEEAEARHARRDQMRHSWLDDL